MVQAEIQQNLDKIRAAYLSAEDLKVAASIIYNAYHDDPIFLQIFQSEKRRLRIAVTFGYTRRTHCFLGSRATYYWLV